MKNYLFLLFALMVAAANAADVNLDSLAVVPVKAPVWSWRPENNYLCSPVNESSRTCLPSNGLR